MANEEPQNDRLKIISTWLKKQVFLRLPVIEWLPIYEWKHQFLRDFAAGVVYTSLTIPQALQYSSVSKIEQSIVLWSSVIPPIFYFCFGSIQICSFAPSLSSAYLSLALFQNHRKLGFTDFEIVTFCTFVTGILYLLLFFLQFSVVLNLLTKPVRIGFLQGYIINVVLDCLIDMLGLTIKFEQHLLVRFPFYLYYACKNIVTTSLPTACLSLAILILLISDTLITHFCLPNWVDVIPVIETTILMFTILISYLCKFETYGIRVVGNYTSHYPDPAGLNLGLAPTVIVNSILLGLIIIFASNSVSFTLNEEARPSQEIFAYGLTNLFCCWICCFPLQNSVLRSAIGRKWSSTLISTIISSLLSVFIILFGQPVMYFLPQCVYQCVVAYNVLHLFIEFSMELGTIFKSSIEDSLIWAVTVGLSLCVAPEIGLLTGMVFSFRKLLDVDYSKANEDRLKRIEEEKNREKLERESRTKK